MLRKVHLAANCCSFSFCFGHAACVSAPEALLKEPGSFLSARMSILQGHMFSHAAGFKYSYL